MYTDARGGISNTTLLLILLACCVLLIAGVAIGIAIVCCRKASVSQDRSKKGSVHSTCNECLFRNKNGS